jgi:16S rRNA U1498 N3-methylase RsmE
MNYERHKQCYREYLNEIEEIHKFKTTEAAWNYFEFPDEFYEEDMVIWIDPLDGT